MYKMSLSDIVKWLEFYWVVGGEVVKICNSFVDMLGDFEIIKKIILVFE